MAWLEVINGPDRGKTIEIHPGKVFIGRKDGACQVVLNDQKVSRVHASVTITADGLAVLVDENSSNGVMVNGKPINAATLNPNDIFQLGSTEMKIHTVKPGSGDPHLAPSIAAFDPDGMTGSISLLGGSAYNPAGSYTRALKADQAATSIGRDPSNTVVLDHPMVSRFHARIVTEYGQKILYDLDSTNGTYINGQRVNGSVELYPGSLIQISGYSYYFDGHNLVEYNDNAGQVRLDIMSLSKTVPLPGGQKRRLLDNLNIVIEPRQFVAILGGSGAGKSTLLGALSGMRPATSGEIMINGRSLYKEYDIFRSMIGYVPQDDIVHMDLTVREVLTYSARLRMPEDTTENEINNTVNRVMRDLEIESRHDVSIRQLSGGQRKRVSIGVEMLTSPGLFFLDEPTSGLDPGLEKTMMEMLRRLADEGRTIILVTHATFNIDMCDKVIFLTEGGKLAFYGSPQEALDYFGTRDFAEIYKRVSVDNIMSPDQWALEFSESSLYSKYVTGRFNNVVVHNNTADLDKMTSANKVKVSPFKQWQVLTSRYFHIMLHDKKNLQILLLQPVLIAAVIVMIFVNNAPLFQSTGFKQSDVTVTSQAVATGLYQQIQNNTAKDSKARKNMSVSVAMMVFTAIWLGTSNSAREIVKEAPVYLRERRVNLRIAPYLLSKTAVLASVSLIQSLVFLAVIAVGLGLPDFGTNLAAFFLISLASVMMGLAVSAFALNADKAMSTVPLLLVPQILLSGALIPVADVQPAIFQNVFSLAISKWGYELVGGAICKISSLVAWKPDADPFKGPFIGHWWALIVFIAVFYAVSTWGLLRKDKIVD